jgi:hypothetical protein
MGSHFDGKFRFLVEETTKDDSGAMVVSMTLSISDGGWAPPVHLPRQWYCCLCIPSGNRFGYKQIINILQRQQNEWAYKKIMTQYNNQPLPRVSVLWQNRIEEEKTRSVWQRAGPNRKG